MNRALELHDSNLSLVMPNGKDVTVELSPAYLHESVGQPGVDAGSGYLQDVHLQLKGAEIESFASNLPDRIDEGWVVVGDERIDNIIPLPLIALQPAELVLSTNGEQTLRIRAQGIVAILIGPRKGLETFHEIPAS